MVCSSGFIGVLLKVQECSLTIVLRPLEFKVQSLIKGYWTLWGVLSGILSTEAPFRFSGLLGFTQRVLGTVTGCTFPNRKNNS